MVFIFLIFYMHAGVDLMLFCVMIFHSDCLSLDPYLKGVFDNQDIALAILLRT